ncbi:MAG: GGDEF domain-containing protein [Desulfobacula sp.]|jgi:diguanylate cyclase (GGDEF)-like protein|uniref:GGDEF domain-containing protein n=1 Tax=Desulfobacula sp. TaxID=2593537 RepID=UPI001D858FF8|nr:GGDEF domain-containing protein [Desulfobacula sp.]MBT3484567.1 GGDEF domain-containing protein [Desulfobacula sp.]MBT3803937.1 GGDEF domain-containing protein [Desulfobacula sp.]MBT4023552.1 GGDEF domain-containing protein [Desulfobacula sp.]MBT4197780.1 GGDEF domain-containing protein [Desulfobacula sp.]
MKRILTGLFFNLIFLTIAIFSIKLIPHLPARYLPILELFPFILLLISFVMGIKFNRSLVIFSTILFSLVYAYFFWLPAIGDIHNTLILNSIAVLLAVNIALISFYSERGIATFIGLARFSFIGLQVVVLIWLIGSKNPEWIHIINMILFPELKVELLFFSQTALLSILISLFVVSLSYLYRANPFRSAIITSMILVFYAITFPVEEMVSIAILFSFVMLLPLFTLVSESYRMAYLDELTNLPGRRALNETLNKLGSKYCIAMLDVDLFKKFNDTYGHDAGDDVLRLLCNKLKAVSGGGKSFRYGGEEFTVVFPGITAPEAKLHLELLRENIANNRFMLRKQERRTTGKKNSTKKNNREVKVTISIGYAERSEKAKTPDKVLKQADKALYRAKGNGRNCVSN